MNPSDRDRKITASAIIPATPDRVYALLADYRDGHPAILPPQFRKLTVVEGGNGEGTVFDLRVSVMGSSRTIRMRVTEPAPGRTLVETDVDRGTETHFTVADGWERGTTELTIETGMDFQPGVRGAIERWVVKRFLTRLYAVELGNIQRYFQRRRSG